MKLVVRLMERLLDYRTIMHDENKENRMSCTVNVLVSRSQLNTQSSQHAACKWSQGIWEPGGQLAIEHIAAELPPTEVLFGTGKEGQRVACISQPSEHFHNVPAVAEGGKPSSFIAR